MPYLAGESLRDRLNREKQLGIADAIQHRQSDRIGARLRASPWRNSPGHQARERALSRWPRAGRRLRHRARGQQGGRRPHDADGHVARHAAVHEPRAGDRRPRRSPPAPMSTRWAPSRTRCSSASRRSPDPTRRPSSRRCSPTEPEPPSRRAQVHSARCRGRGTDRAREAAGGSVRHRRRVCRGVRSARPSATGPIAARARPARRRGGPAVGHERRSSGGRCCSAHRSSCSLQSPPGGCCTARWRARFHAQRRCAWRSRSAPPAWTGHSLEISPDGRRVIQVVSDSDGVDRIMMRDLGSMSVAADPRKRRRSGSRVLPRRRVDQLQCRRQAAQGARRAEGRRSIVADSASVGGGAWTPDGSIIFTRDGRGLWSVPSSGGHPQTAHDARYEHGRNSITGIRRSFPAGAP